MIKVAGANVSPREIEAVLEEFPEVAHCVVTGVAHPTRGEEVCIVLAPAAPAAATDAGVPLDTRSLAGRARGLLSSYKVPTRWIVATADEVPSLPSGKPDRRGLRARVEQGHLTPSTPPGTSGGQQVVDGDRGEAGGAQEGRDPGEGCDRAGVTEVQAHDGTWPQAGADPGDHRVGTG